MQSIRRAVLILAVSATLAACAGCASGQRGEVSEDASPASMAASIEKTETETPSGSNATIVTADDVLARADDVVLVDTRTPEEFAEGHIPGALNASYPHSDGSPNGIEESAASFRANWEALGIPQNVQIILYCRTGKRANSAATTLLEDGYSSVSVYEGSWTDWTGDPGRPVEK